MADIKFVSKEWQEKRKKILKRDNYTCQKCKTFNPSLGTVEINRTDNTFELHDYESSPGHSIYRIASSRKGITLEMDFCLDWLVLPVLQIHHKRYIENRKPWDYEDEDLITLCKQCHTSIHEKIEIPLFDADDNLILSKKYSPEDYGSGHNHDFKPWVFIHSTSKKGEYEISGVTPTLKLLLFKDEQERIEEILDECAFIMQDFFDRFLPDYKPSTTPNSR